MFCCYFGFGLSITVSIPMMTMREFRALFGDEQQRVEHLGGHRWPERLACHAVDASGSRLQAPKITTETRRYGRQEFWHLATLPVRLMRRRDVTGSRPVFAGLQW